MYRLRVLQLLLSCFIRVVSLSTVQKLHLLDEVVDLLREASEEKWEVFQQANLFPERLEQPSPTRLEVRGHHRGVQLRHVAIIVIISAVPFRRLC
mmetsp:Transcript_34310/g.47148  ORF Transcript_34310/g.47148 Transcript_34310/m.47148 type:complete len:95 (+) Transcript_34310:40-324(+)